MTHRWTWPHERRLMSTLFEHDVIRVGVPPSALWLLLTFGEGALDRERQPPGNLPLLAAAKATFTKNGQEPWNGQDCMVGDTDRERFSHPNQGVGIWPTARGRHR